LQRCWCFVKPGWAELGQCQNDDQGDKWRFHSSPPGCRSWAVCQPKWTDENSALSATKNCVTAILPDAVRRPARRSRVSMTILVPVLVLMVVRVRVLPWGGSLVLPTREAWGCRWGRCSPDQLGQKGPYRRGSRKGADRGHHRHSGRLPAQALLSAQFSALAHRVCTPAGRRNNDSGSIMGAPLIRFPKINGAR